MDKYLKYGLGALALAAFVAAMFLLPVGDWLLAVVAWVQGAGALGIAAFFLVYVVAVVVMAPGSILTLGAGFVWGPIGGLLIVSPASVLGATLAFLLGRTALRDRVQIWVAGNQRFQAIDEAVGRRGFSIVTLLRLSPVFPFVLLNYALGLTKVKTWHYVLASFLGMLPGTLMFAYLGSTVKNLAAIASGEATQDPATRWLYWGGLVATIAVTVLVTRIATRALREQADLPEDPSDDPITPQEATP